MAAPDCKRQALGAPALNQLVSHTNHLIGNRPRRRLGWPLPTAMRTAATACGRDATHGLRTLRSLDHGS
jgi:hypothetical protein